MSNRPGSRKFLALSVILAVVTLSLCGCKDDDGGVTPPVRHPEDFLPPGTEGMPKYGSPRIATNVDELQEIVNGGYQDYSNNGFQEMVEQNYVGSVGGSPASATVRIFDLDSAENAAAVHGELTREGNWEVVEGLGDEAHQMTSGSLAHTLQFRRSLYWVSLVINSTVQDAKDLLLLFAIHIDQEIIG